MSKYSEKVSRRRLALLQPQECEPEDVYSILPDPAVRKYFRARASMYGMTTKPYRSIKIELPPRIFARLESGCAAYFAVCITPNTAQALGELVRDIRARHAIPVSVFSVPFGARRRVYVDKVKEMHSDRGALPNVEFCVYPYANAAKPLRRNWGVHRAAMEAHKANKRTFRTGSGISGEANRRCKLALPGLWNCEVDAIGRSKPADIMFSSRHNHVNPSNRRVAPATVRHHNPDHQLTTEKQP